MMKRTLIEYRRECGVPLSASQAAVLAGPASPIGVEVSSGQPGVYDLTPGSMVGHFTTPDLDIRILPKVGVDRLMFLLAYSADTARWRELVTEFGHAEDVYEAVVPAFVRLVARATHRGLLHGYRSLDDSLATVRGRIRIADQVRTRIGLMPPVEVQYDEFTADIIENRIIRAALDQLRACGARSPTVARALREVEFAFRDVHLCKYSPQAVPEVSFTRLNEHYKPAIRLATLLLRSASFELRSSGVAAPAFLVDMNRVFEAFVHRALEEMLPVGKGELRRGAVAGHLDTDDTIALKPDLTYWRSGRCVFVGDAKYKVRDGDRAASADVYQMLAYLTALDLRSGVIVYPTGEAEPRRIRIGATGQVIELLAIPLNAPPTAILASMADLALRATESARRDAASWVGSA